MTFCSYCNKRESRSRTFSKPNACKECHNDTANDVDNRDEITFIDECAKDDDNNSITTETFINDRFQNIVNNSIKSQVKDELQKLLSDKTINGENYKDALLANLYSSMELLKGEIAEKNCIIEKLFALIPSISCTSFVKSVETSHDDPHTSKISSSQLKAHDYPPENNLRKCYSWITSNESSCHYDSETSDVNDNSLGDCNDTLENSTNNQNTPSSNEAFIKSTKINYNDYLQAIDIVSVINGVSNNGISNTTNSITEDVINNNNHEWPPNTCLIVGDSILNNLDESKLSKRNIPVKVRSFSGCTIEDMYCYIRPLLRKKPSHIILHVSTNDAPNKSADDILTGILLLKTFILKQLPGVNIIISEPTTRCDNPRAKVTIRNLNAKLHQLNILMVDNSNIDVDQIAKKGLHLNKWGSSRLAMNFLSLIRQL